jgi:hypothetical protein
MVFGDLHWYCVSGFGDRGTGLCFTSKLLSLCVSVLASNKKEGVMGLNYYLQQKATAEEQKVLTKFNVKLPQLHIGKSSFGWEFLFQAYTPWTLGEFCSDMTEKGIRSIEAWVEMFKDDRFDIVDEYGTKIWPQSLMKIIMDKRGGLNHITECMKKETDRSHVREHCFFDRTGHPFCDNDFS